MEDAMCDYSLEMYGSRPAREGEKYVTTRFPSGTIGLAALGDRSTPVCVQCDTKLMLEEVPKSLQDRLGVTSRAEATFVRLERGPYFDGVKFSNGSEVSLQQLDVGVIVAVTMLLENTVRRRGAIPVMSA
jgi:hypothetical protein